MKQIPLMIVSLLALTGCYHDGVTPSDIVADSTGAALQEQVNEIEIDWVDGSIDIRYYDGDEVLLSETSDKPLNDSTRMVYRLRQSGELTIDYCRGELRGVKTNGLNKRLLVRVPRGMPLDDIEIDGVNTVITIDSVLSSSLEVDAVNLVLNATYDTFPAEISVDGVNTKVNLYVCRPEETLLYADCSGVFSRLDSEVPMTDRKAYADCKIEVEGVNSRTTIMRKGGGDGLQ